MDGEIPAIIVLSLIYAWVKIAPGNKVFLIIVGVIFGVIFLVIHGVVYRSLRKKTKPSDDTKSFLAGCVGLFIVVLLMAIWLIVAKLIIMSQS